MYGQDITPIFNLAFAALGAAIGFIIALIAWAFAPLGWWTFAIPLAGAVIGWNIMTHFNR